MVSEDGNPKELPETKLGKRGKKKSGDAAGVNEQKWGKELWSNWVGLPAVLIRHQSAFGITPTQMNVLLCLVDRWGWRSPTDLPRLSAKTMARTIGINEKTVRSALSELVRLGLIESRKRHRSDGGRTSNEYSFDGLKAKARAVLAVIKRKESQLDSDSHALATQKASLRVSKAELDEELVSSKIGGSDG